MHDDDEKDEFDPNVIDEMGDEREEEEGEKTEGDE